MPKILSSIGAKPYFGEKNFFLYHGDAFDLLAQIPENSVDMIFADPPYNLSNGGFTVHAGKMVSVNKGDWDKSNGFDKDYAFHKQWIEACRRILKPHGTLWVSGTYHSIYQCGHAIQSAGYHILNDIAWFKPNASPNLSCRYFTASHETLIWARKKKKAKHIFNYEVVRDWEKNHQRMRKCDNCKAEVYIETTHEPKKQMRSVWALGTPKRDEKAHGKHPTQKPIDLLDIIIHASTNKGDVIVDPFTGSSTTGISAAKHGRRFIGMDTEKEYLDLSKKRFKDLAI